MANDDPLLFSMLTTAYGSASRARAALAGALARAALDGLPASPTELTSFLCTHLRAQAEEDLGRMIADALTEELLFLVDAPEQVPAPVSVEAVAEPVSEPISKLRLRKAASIMLVRVDEAEEARILVVDDFEAGVLRVRHPLQACERIRVMRPLVVIVGTAVQERDVELLTKAGRETGCQVLELGAFVATAALHAELRRALARASSRKSPSGAGDPTVAERTTVKPGKPNGSRT